MGKNLGARVQAAQDPGRALTQAAETAIGRMEDAFKRALPRNGPDAAQLVRDSLTLVRQTPKLAECEQMSFLGALMTCAQLGLRPGIGALGEAWVLPMNNWNPKTRQKEMQAVFIIGYPGMLALANRSGQIAHITANAVRQNDHFEADFATGRISHPVRFTEDRGDIVGFYSAFTRMDSDVPAAAEFMSLAEMQRHRDKFAMAKKQGGEIVGPWASDFEAMARKTMVRQLFKWMPRTTEIQNAMVTDNTVRLDTAPDADLSQVARPAQEPEAVEGQVMDNSRGIPATRSGQEQQPEGFNPDTGEMYGPDPDEAWGTQGAPTAAAEGQAR